MRQERPATFDRIRNELWFCVRWKKFLSGISWNKKDWEKMKNENEKEEKNQLLVELCYNYHFHRSDSSILDHNHCEKNFQEYSINQKIWPRHFVYLKNQACWAVNGTAQARAFYNYLTLSGKKMSGESDENFEGVTKFFPDEKFPRHFITRPKLLPDFFIPDRNFYQKFYTPTQN